MSDLYISYQIFVVINFIIDNGHNATLKFWNGSTNNRKIANKGKIMIFVAAEIVVEDTQNQYVTFDLEKQIADLR